MAEIKPKIVFPPQKGGSMWASGKLWSQSGGGGSGVPADAILDEDGAALLDEDGAFLLEDA